MNYRLLLFIKPFIERLIQAGFPEEQTAQNLKNFMQPLNSFPALLSQ
ncbi:MAG: hypothetical protein ICV51_02180 [Flavisolibacter sp.]|nr:hypothetical protein [Flavisolibacter sp.]